MLWCHKALLTTTMSTLELSDITALFGVFLETNEHQNLMILRPPIVKAACSYSGQEKAILATPIFNTLPLSVWIDAQSCFSGHNSAPQQSTQLPQSKGAAACPPRANPLP